MARALLYAGIGCNLKAAVLEAQERFPLNLGQSRRSKVLSQLIGTMTEISFRSPRTRGRAV